VQVMGEIRNFTAIEPAFSLRYKTTAKSRNSTTFRKGVFAKTFVVDAPFRTPIGTKGASCLCV